MVAGETKRDSCARPVTSRAARIFERRSSGSSGMRSGAQERISFLFLILSSLVFAARLAQELLLFGAERIHAFTRNLGEQLVHAPRRFGIDALGRLGQGMAFRPRGAFAARAAHRDQFPIVWRNIPGTA